ncbi:MAG: serine/threonine protein phosphatase, partial [Bdellovibrionales bacterium]|nr:serine/threonine protein phosphatase [Bdellovibrionales bacterium]
MSSDRWIAIGDIHGCADELESLIEQLPIDDNTHLVFLGDYVDRGPNSKKVIQMVIDLKKRCDVIALKGNHEAMMLDFLKDPSSVSAGLFILNGGSATLASYSTGSEKFHIPDDHLEFLESLKFYHETDDYFFVHAGVPDVPLNKIDIKKHSLDLIWIRSAFHTSTFQWDKVIVHGHTVVEQVEMLENRINLDTGCVFQGRLSALDLSDRQLYQVS